jgi:hypothetical protein
MAGEIVEELPAMLIGRALGEINPPGRLAELSVTGLSVLLHGECAEWRRTVLLANRSCTVDFCKEWYFHGVTKADLRISIKDYHRIRNLKILLFQPPFPGRQFVVRMNGALWPAGEDPCR